MKKIFLLILGFVMFKVGYSQGYPIQQFIGADSAVVTSKGGMQGRFINVVFPDTTTANSQRIRQYPGAMIYAAGKMWVRNTTATGWTELAYGPISTTNIYNSDGTLTGNRELDGNSNNLTFTAVNKFEFSGDSLYYFLDPAGNLRLKLGNQQFTMQGDTASLSRRISYTGNLGSSFTKHSLVDRNYVDSSITASPSGTVTSVATNNATGITGGPITTTGTLAIDTNLISTRAWRQKGIDSVTSLINARPSGSGTTNYIPKWTGSTALGNSQIFDNGTSVGIGTATPSASYLLDVSGASRVSGNTYLATTSQTSLNIGSSNFSGTLWSNGSNLFIGSSGYVSGSTSADFSIGSNAYFDGSVSKRIRSGYHSGIYFDTNGDINISSAGTAAANSTITATTNAVIKNNGNFLIGSTVDAGFKLSVTGTFRSTLDANINGLTVGKGGGSVSTNTMLGVTGYPNGATGTYNVNIGYTNLIALTNGTSNVAIGGGSGYFLQSGGNNIFLGYAAGRVVVSGGNNINLGSYSGYSNTANSNIYIGVYTGFDATTSSNNTFIGDGTGRGITTGGNNTIIGANVTGLSSSLSNTIILADGQGNQRLYINSSGNVGIGTTSPTTKLDVVGRGRFGSQDETRAGIFVGNPGRVQISNTYGGGYNLFLDANYSYDPFVTMGFGSGTNPLTANPSANFLEIGSENATFGWSGNVNLNFKSGGATRFMLSRSTYNFLIGTTTDAGYKLDVNGTARVQNNSGLSLMIGTTTETSTATPAILSLGGTFGSSTAGNVANLKFRVFENTNPGQAVGFGVSSGLFEIHSFVDMAFFSGNSTSKTQRMRIFDATGNVLVGTTTVASTTTPTVLSLGATFGSNTAGSASNLKLRIYGGSGAAAFDDIGFGASSSLLEVQSFADIGFFTGNSTSRTERMRIKQDGSVGIGTTSPNASALLDVSSTTKGFAPPRGTNAQMLAIVSPVAGLIFYDTTNNKLNVYDGTNWVTLH